MVVINISADIEAKTLVFDIVNQLTSSQVADLIMAIDRRLADYDFTEQLIARLQASLDEDERNSNG